MGNKKTTSSARGKSPSKKKKFSNETTLRPAAKDVKFSLTFLMDTTFKSNFYKKGDVIEVEAHEAKAYQNRSAYKFEQL